MKKKNLEKQAVIFDLDGVLTDSMPYHVRAFQKAFEPERIRVKAHDVLLCEGMPTEELVKVFLGMNNREITPGLVDRLAEAKEEHFKKLFRQKFIKGSRAFLKKMKRKGLVLALVTGTSAENLTMILPAEILQYFEVIITADDIEKGKPNADPYEKALKKLAVDSESALVIENAPLGIRAAKKAGIECAALTTTLKKKHLEKADYLFPSYKRLTRKLRIAQPAAVPIGKAA